MNHFRGAVVALAFVLATSPAWAQMADQPDAFQAPPQQVIQTDGSFADQQRSCVGAVVNDQCEGTVAPDAPTATCYGQMIGGLCTGSLQQN